MVNSAEEVALMKSPSACALLRSLPQKVCRGRVDRVGKRAGGLWRPGQTGGICLANSPCKEAGGKWSSAR